MKKLTAAELWSELETQYPELKKDKKRGLPALELLLQSQPTAAIDEVFVKNLRAELQTKMASTPAYCAKAGFKYSSNFYFSSMKKISYFAAGMLTVAISLVSFGQFDSVQLWSLMPKVKVAQSNSQVVAVAKEAFGNLGNMQVAKNTAVAATDTGVVPLAPTESAYALDGTSYDKEMLMSSPAKVRYKFAGQLNLPAKSLPVYKRTLNLQTGKFAGKLLSKLDFDNINLDDPTIQNILIKEEEKFGHEISLDLANNSVGIYPNFDQWPNRFEKCLGEVDADETDNEATMKCYDSLRVKQSDLLSDTENLQIAAQFLAEKGVDLANYGQPFVDNSWTKSAKLIKGAPSWVPENITVVYPLKVADQKVVEWHHGVAGLRVQVNQLYKKVESVNNIVSQQYESSDYATEQDAQRITEIAKNGGYPLAVGIDTLYFRAAEEEATRTVEATLGQPQQVLLQMWHLDKATDTEETLFVPALSFPVIEKPAGDDALLVRDQVIVPLTKKILDEYEE